MGDDQRVQADVMKRFSDLFVPYRRVRGVQKPDGGYDWQQAAVTDELIGDHLIGQLTLAVLIAGKEAAEWQGRHIVLDVDYASEDEEPGVAKARALGNEGLRDVHTIQEVGSTLGIPPEQWIVEFSGCKGLHLGLILEEAAPLADLWHLAHTIRRLATAEGMVGKFDRAYPTSPDERGSLIKLPWGKHRKSGEFSVFVDVSPLHLRPRCSLMEGDAKYLDVIEARRVPADMIALALARAREVPAADRVAASRRGTPPVRDYRGSTSDVCQAIGRPCISRLIREGAAFHYRHDLALPLRTELKRVMASREETLRVVLEYAANCHPPWEKDQARRDADQEATTDARKAHLCPGRRDPTAITQYLHANYCVGQERCAWERAGQFQSLWLGRVTANELAVYTSLVQAEVQYRLRPGDEMRTTQDELCHLSGIGKAAVKSALDGLTDKGLVSSRVQGRGRGQGRCTVIWRTYPVPAPTGDLSRRQAQLGEDRPSASPGSLHCAISILQEVHDCGR